MNFAVTAVCSLGSLPVQSMACTNSSLVILLLVPVRLVGFCAVSSNTIIPSLYALKYDHALIIDVIKTSQSMLL